MLKPARSREMLDLVFDYFPMLREMSGRVAIHAPPSEVTEDQFERVFLS